MSNIEAATSLAASSTSARAARRFVRRVLETTDAPEVVIETAELLTSELVTNVVVHLGTASDLIVRSIHGTIRIQVTDHDHRIPTPHQPPDGATSGRGLCLVDTLAQTWGVDTITDNGKTIWFEIQAD